MSGAIIQVSERLYSYLKDNEENGSYILNDNINSNLLSLLIDNRIIYTNEGEELCYLEYLHIRDKHDDSYLSVVLLPTLRCNLNCHYCYEKNKGASISKDNLSILKLFFAKQAQIRKGIAIRWSGGEVLTNWKLVKELSRHVIEQCKINNCIFTASVISNATLLTEDIVDEMCECNIKSIQITLDGDRSCHNTVRFFVNGEGTFDKIMRSIEIASQKMKVIVRLNIDKKNFTTIEGLFIDLSQRSINKNNIQLFCKPVFCTQVRTPQNDLFNQNEFYDVELELLRLAEKYDIPYSFHWGIKGYHIRCAYNNLQGYYVTPNLKLYKCPVYIDNSSTEQDDCVGYISFDGDLTITNHKILLKNLSYSPFKTEECMTCKVLPICHGKCSIIWENSERKPNEGCIPDKYSIEAKIKYALRNELQMNALFKSGIV